MPAAQLSTARRLERRAGRTSASQSTVRKQASTNAIQPNVGLVAGLGVAEEPRDARRHAVAVGVDPEPPRRAGEQAEGQDAEPVERAREAALQRVDLQRGEQRERHEQRHQARSRAAPACSASTARITSASAAGSSIAGTRSPPLKPRPRIHSVHSASGSAGQANQGRFLSEEQRVAADARPRTPGSTCSAHQAASCVGARQQQRERPRRGGAANADSAIAAIRA